MHELSKVIGKASLSGDKKLISEREEQRWMGCVLGMVI